MNIDRFVKYCLHVKKAGVSTERIQRMCIPQNGEEIIGEK